MKNILLIGAKGLVGKDFCERYISKYNIFQVDKDNIGNVASILNAKSFEYLIFLAQSEDFKLYPYTQNLLDVNVVLLRDIIEMSINRVSNIIYFSSGSVYEQANSIFTEQSKLNFTDPNPYVASKISGELTLLSMKQSFETVTILRPFFIFGQYQNNQMLIPSLIEKIQSKQLIYITSEDGLLFNPTFVSDVSDYLSFIIENNIKSHIQNIFGNEVITLKDFCDEIGLIIGKKPEYSYLNIKSLKYVASTINEYYHPKAQLKESIERIININLFKS
jgi:nucleoside-diphosphate-sugar epimerase